MPLHGGRPFTAFARGALSAARQNPTMDAITAIAQSGLTTASTRVQVSASNLANMDDASTPPGPGAAGSAPFVPTRVAPVSLPQGGVQAQLSAAPPGTEVDPASELVEQMQAMQQYRASAALIRTDDELQKSAIDMLS